MASNTPKKPNKELGNLMVSYGNVYFLEGFDPVQVTDEERRFYELLTKAHKGQGFHTPEMSAFRNYVLKLVTSIGNGFQTSVIQRFENINKQSEKSLSTLWVRLHKQLGEISVQLVHMNFTNIVMIGLSLLFMLRTSRRCLFIYLHNINKQPSQSDMYTALYDVLSYISAFLSNFEKVDIHALLLPAYNITEKLLNIMDIFVKTSPFNDSITTKLDKGKAILALPQVVKMIHMLLRMNAGDDGTNVNSLKKFSVNKFESEKYNEYNQLYTACKYVMMLKYMKMENLIEVASGMEPLYVDGEVYQYLVELNEILSGAVRVIVKVRRVSLDKMNGGSRKAQSVLANLHTYLKAIAYAKNTKHVHRLHGGSTSQQSQLFGANDVYTLDINKQSQDVTFNGIPNAMHDLLFSKYNELNITKSVPYTYKFGPFYAVHDSNDNTDDIIQNTLNMNNIIKKFHDASETQTIVFYTYGYSGSGKTYTLFGETNKPSQVDANNGIVWKIMDALSQQGFEVRLIETAKCYGTLSSSKTLNANGILQYEFLDTPNKETCNISQPTEWLKVINDVETIEKDPITGLTLPSSFTKSTPNNDKSSRGFFIMKFEVTNKDHQDKVKSHYIGVVDMAGNEDPVDIQSVMLPTLSYDQTPSVLQQTDATFTNDIIYGQLLTNLQNVFYNVLGFIIAKQQDGILLKEKYTHALPNIVSLKAIKEKLESLDNEIARLKLPKDKEKKTENQKKLKELEQQLTNLNIQNLMQLKNVPYEVKADTFHTTRYQWELTFTINKDLIQDIVTSSIEKLLVKLENQIDANLNSEKSRELDYLKNLKPNLATIKNEIIQAQAKGSTDKERLSIVMLKFISDNIGSIQLQNNVFQMILRLKKGVTSFNWYINNKDGVDDFKGQIKTALLSFFKAQPYIFVTPTPKGETQLQHTHDTIATIIKEGYFINQANAELIHYFNQKRNGKQSTPKKGETNKYTFEEKFALSKYNKFKRVTETQYFETWLVPTIHTMFGSNSLDIMFACLRDEKDAGKVKGAVDTLYLVRDIKST